ncbi:hypothetical protein [Nocardia amamiensis]|uniref:hypothetical protein n=1 Tax=Nocardia amamiensis TaxID=404578 RepID=UPI000833D0B5|nr:hypothetical protein [Nocardia amamiensis]
MSIGTEFPSTPRGHQRHLLAIPFETDFTFDDVVTVADPLEQGITDEERVHRHQAQHEQIAEYNRRVGEAALRVVEQMAGNPLARHGFLFGNPVEAKELVAVEGLTGAAGDERFFEPAGGWPE